MSRRASLVSSTLGCRPVRLSTQAASSRACAVERPACVSSMRSSLASARAARGGSKRRATSSRQPVSFDHERSVTLRFGSRASSPGSEWRPERSPVESTTTRVANDQQAPTSGSQRSGSRRSRRKTGRSGSSRLAIRLGRAAPSLPAARRTSSQRSSAPPPLGDGRRHDLGAGVHRALATLCQRDDRPRRAVARQVLEQPRHAVGLARIVGEHHQIEQLRARLAPLAAAQLGEALLDLGDRAHGRRHLRPSRASRSSAASGPQPPAA